MDVVFKMMPDGGFVAGDRDSEMTAYAYPSSPHALVAKKHPKAVAEDMLESERMEYRRIQAVLDYDAANWRKISGVDENAKYVNHINGDATDNSLSNLDITSKPLSSVWCYTCSRPTAHCFGHSDEEVAPKT